MFQLDLPTHLQHLIKQELDIGETIVWAGVPVRKFFTPNGIATFIFGVPWTAFAVFWTLAAGAGMWSLSNPLSLINVFPLFGVPFIVIGIGMLLTPVFEYRKSGKTAYVITDRRAISFVGGKSTEVRSFEPESLKKLFRREKKNGTGDIIIHSRGWKDSEGDTQHEENGFIRVREVKRVEGLLKALAERR